MEIVSQSTIESNPLFATLVEQVLAVTEAAGNSGASFKVLEATALHVANLAVRAVLERKLQAVADSFSTEELLIDGRLFRRHLAGKVSYHSLCGPLAVKRFSYRPSDERNGATVIPLELASPLVEGATPALGYSVALGYGEGELRGYAEEMEAAHRKLPSRSTLERMGKAIGNEARKEAPRIEAILRTTELLPDGANGISMGLDRVAVPMEEDRAEGAPAKTRRKERTEPYQRAKPGPVDVNFRMAYVGTVSIVDRQGEELVTRRYTALPEAEPDEVVERVMEDVRHALHQKEDLKVGVVQDGAPEMWNATERGLKKAEVLDWQGTIDRYHLNERLGGVLQLVEPHAGVRKRILSEWNDDLDASDEAVGGIQNWLLEQIDNVKGKDSEEKYLGHLSYLENNQDRMKYQTTRQNGLPIGSGLTEGACKSVVGQRACGSAQRWRPEGLAAALTLRAIHRSDRLPGFWDELSKGYTADIRMAA